MTSAEADIRSYIHDALHSHHAKDYRTFQTLTALDDITLQVHRVNQAGMLSIDTLVGTSPDSEEHTVPVLIWRGHMRLLLATRPGEPRDLGALWAKEGRLSRQLTALGWRELLAEADAEGSRWCRLSSGRSAHSAGPLLTTGRGPHTSVRSR